MKPVTYLVLTIYEDLDALPVDLWEQRGRKLLARSPLEACESVLIDILKRPWPEKAIVYVSLGSQRHPNGTPMCVQKYVVTATDCEASNA